MKIAITGAGGFLGRKLVDSILQNTVSQVMAITSQSRKLKDFYGSLGNRFFVVSNAEAELIDWSSVDLLINCAFPTKADGIQMARGLSFISDIVSFSVHNGVGAVINISSQSVYSQERKEPATEESDINPGNQYAIGKYAAELLTNHICGANVAHTNIRLASLIGPGEQRFINKFVEQALNGNDIHIIGGLQRFGFLDVRDAVNGLLSIINSDPRVWQEVYNLGANKSYTIEEIAQCVCSLSAKYCARAIDYTAEPSDVMKNSEIDSTVFQQTFNWQPQHRLEDMVAYIYESKSKGV